jgi:hypothetical protein
VVQRRYVCGTKATLRDMPDSLDKGAHILATLPARDEFAVDQPILKGIWAHGSSRSLGKAGWVLIEYVRVTCT